MIVSDNATTSPSMMEEIENKEKTDNHENVTDTSLDHNKKGKGTCPDITFPDIMEEIEYMKYSNDNDNEMETSLNTLNQESEKSPNITSPAMMEENGNKNMMITTRINTMTVLII